MAKFSKKTTEKIVGLIKSDTYTIAEIGRQVGIAPRTYHSWIEDNPEFAKAVEDAKAERMQMFVIEAKKSLLKKIQGYEGFNRTFMELKLVACEPKAHDKRSFNRTFMELKFFLRSAGNLLLRCFNRTFMELK